MMQSPWMNMQASQQQAMGQQPDPNAQQPTPAPPAPGAFGQQSRRPQQMAMTPPVQTQPMTPPAAPGMTAQPAPDANQNSMAQAQAQAQGLTSPPSQPAFGAGGMQQKMQQQQRMNFGRR